MAIYAVMLVAVGFAFTRLPGGFLPVDDQGFFTTDVQTPSDASFPRTLEAVKKRRGVSGQAPGRRQRDVPHRLQLPRPGPEHRAGLRHVERLVGTRQKRSLPSRSLQT